MLLLAALPPGCAAPPARLAEGLSPADRLCAPHARPHRAALRVDPPLPEGDFLRAVEELAPRGYSRPAVEIADSIGALAELRRLATLDAAGPPRGTESALRRLALRQAIGERVLGAMLDIAAVLAELDCEGERGDQLQAVLQARETRRLRRLTIGSILAGALTAGVTGGLGLGGAVTAASIAGIAGGATEAGFGAAQLGGGPTGMLATDRNLLGELWRRPAEPVLFPQTVWNYLVRVRTGPVARQAGPVAEALAAAWAADGRLGAPGSEEARARAALLFGAGGRYTADELETREALLELVQASVSLMNRDLRLLLADLQATGRVP